MHSEVLRQFVQEAVRKAAFSDSRFRADADTVYKQTGDLEYVITRTYDIKYPGLLGRMLAPESQQASPGDTEVSYDQFDRTGKAKIGARGNFHDIPLVGVNMQRFTRPTNVISAGYQWDTFEQMSFARAGRDVLMRRAASARRIIEEELDLTLALGNTQVGITGSLLQDSGITADTASGAWLSATTDALKQALLDDVAGMWRNIRSDTNGVEGGEQRSMTLVLPIAQHSYIMTTPFGDNSDKTIGDFMMANFQFLREIVSWYRCDTAGPGSTPRAMLYTARDDLLTHELPQDFTQRAPRDRGAYGFMVPADLITAGVVWYYPLSARYLNGL